MLAGSGAPPPEEIQLKENISSGSYPKKTDSEYWPVISANALIDQNLDREVGQCSAIRATLNFNLDVTMPRWVSRDLAGVLPPQSSNLLEI
jgi:hypothetical protein